MARKYKRGQRAQNVPLLGDIDENIELTTYTSMGLTTDYGAWYWKFIPHYREVIDPNGTDELESLNTSGNGLRNDSESFFEIDNAEKYEIRDEANRPWWKFFDEYEYRYNKKTREQKNWWHWFDKDTSWAEKKLICKLDLLIVGYTIMGYWSKQLNVANLNNAYVSGMKEDLGMYGNELSNATALYNAGSVIFQVVFMYLFPRVPLQMLFFVENVLWSLITAASTDVRNVTDLYLSRFFVGAAESGFFMLVHYVLGSWYKPEEIGRRGGLFYCGLHVGTLTSGLLQAQIYESLDNKFGRAGWRWMFLLDGIMTLPIAFWGLYSIPGTPENCHSLFLTDEEILLARRRLRAANVKTPSKKPPPFFNWKLWKKVLTSWQIYVLMILDGLFWNASGPSKNAGFPLWLKSLNRYDKPKLNRLTSIPSALAVPFTLMVCFSADIMKSRSIAIIWGTTIAFTSNLILAIWDVSENSKWFAFYVSYFSITISSVIYGWLNDIMRFDAQQRSIVLCWVNMFANQSTTWMVLLTFPTSEGPRFKRGYRFATSVDAVLIIWVVVTYLFYKREEKKYAKSNGIILYNSAKGELPPEGYGDASDTYGARDNDEVESVTVHTDSKK